MPSADGRGRTIFEILTGRNKRDMTPLEFQHYNPLEAKVGCTVNFEHNEELGNINFFIEAIYVYETDVDGKKFYHTDYLLKGNSLNLQRPLRMRLRLSPDPDSTSELGHKMQVLKVTDELEYDEGLEAVLNDESGIFQVTQDDDGNQFDESDYHNYHRVDQVRDPYVAKVTMLDDDNSNGEISQEELTNKEIVYWDYFRTDAVDPNTDQNFTEYLNVEMNKESGMFLFLRGQEVPLFTVSVI